MADFSARIPQDDHKMLRVCIKLRWGECLNEPSG
jgi:hypothetical protein